MKTFRINTTQITTTNREYFVDALSMEEAKREWAESIRIGYLNDESMEDGEEDIISVVETDKDGHELKDLTNEHPHLDGLYE